MHIEGNLVITASANASARALRPHPRPADALITMLLVLFELSTLKLR